MRVECETQIRLSGPDADEDFIYQRISTCATMSIQSILFKIYCYQIFRKEIFFIDYIIYLNRSLTR